MTSTHVPANREKMKRLTHYVIARSENPSVLGSVKLNKILWFSDVAAYLNWGQTLTGDRYVKRQFGPVPRNILSVLGELQDEGKVLVRKITYYGREKTDYLALEAPETLSDLFTADEISLVDKHIASICGRHSARSISHLSHNDIWRLATIGEEMPMNAMFGSYVGEVTPEDMVWAQSVVSHGQPAA